MLIGDGATREVVVVMEQKMDRVQLEARSRVEDPHF